MMKYIDEKKENGIEYDINLICRECKKLKIYPAKMWNPLYIIKRKNAINMLLSERSIGKTTGILLLGMVFNKLYKTKIHYIRMSKEELKSNIVADLFDTINAYHYVSIITEERFNQVRYFPNERRWYYVNIDEKSGEIVEKANEWLMIGMSADKSKDYKSGYSCDLADFIIVDEFILIDNYKNYFLQVQDIFSTLLRFRLSGYIFFLANTVDKTSYWFDEYDISAVVNQLQKGEYREIQKECGSTIYLEFLDDENVTKRKEKVNKRYFGFNNSKLASITGSGWSTKSYPHYESKEGDRYISQCVYLDYNECLLALNLIETSERGMIVFVHKATKLYPDSYVYSKKKLNDPRYHFNFGRGNKIDNLIWNILYKNGLFRYATNSDGHIVENFVKECIINKYD